MAAEPPPALEPFPAEGPLPSWSDARLVRECLNGNEQAWAAVIQKYKRLIYSIPFKYGLTPEDAGDVFQAVCLELFSELVNLRKAEALQSWLISVTIHTCLRWKKQRLSGHEIEADSLQQEPPDAAALAPFTMLEQLEKEQSVRQAISRLPARCAEMIRLLFYEQPPLPYAEVARRLGLATGSIGFIRGRCLKRLQKELEKQGLR
ncbi:MAG: sigma-70 family RNA polymerase sigma factor [Acidobacteriia bacterium]|nr:sigma-70 family RNA polymerase sigma factor [Terriglobia bacterium]